MSLSIAAPEVIEGRDGSKTLMLPGLIGMTIVSAKYVEDGGGYQHLMITLSNGHVVHSWEHSQTGEMLVEVNDGEICLP